MATQSGYHWLPSRRSLHHCVIVDGRDSSNSDFKMTSRSCQYLYSFIGLSALPHCSMFSSNTSGPFCFLYHLSVSLSPCGNRRARVANVSSTSPDGKVDFLIDVPCQSVSTEKRDLTYCLWASRNETWWKTSTVLLTSLNRRWSHRFDVGSTWKPAIRIILQTLKVLSNLIPLFSRDIASEKTSRIKSRGGPWVHRSLLLPE